MSENVLSSIHIKQKPGGKETNFDALLVCISAILIVYGANAETSNSWHYVSTDESIMEIMENSSSNVLSLENGIHYGPIILVNRDNLTIKPFSDKATIECMGADVGIYIIGGSNITIEGLSLNNSNNGIKIEGARDCIIENNYINFNNGSGITIDGTHNIKIIKNVIKNDHVGDLFSNGLEVYYSMDNFLSGNSFVLQGNSTLVLLYHSFNNIIYLDQCGKIIDNSNEFNCETGCYQRKKDCQLNNSWHLKPDFC